MIRKCLVLIFLFLLFSPLTNAAENTDELLYQTITESEAKELNIKIPSNTPPGFKSLEVQISGMGQDSKFKKILFCKNLKGDIHWDNICPDLTEVAAQTAVDTVKTRDELPAYDPLSDPKQTTNTAVIAFAALSMLTGAGVAASKILERKGAPEEKQSGYLAGLSGGGVLIAGTKLGKGDSSKLWARPINQKIDKFVTSSGGRISGFSPLATRILSDGNYQRSLIGPISLVLYPAAVLVGILASRSLHQEALPPSLAYILVMISFGVADALAGVLLSLTFVLSVFIGGHLNSLDAGLTVAGVCLLAFSPAILAASFRPFRRPVWDFTSLWERATDYLLGSILTGWVVQQIVLGLPGLSGLQLPITKYAHEIALWAALLVVLRFAFEDLSLKFFPKRLQDLEPAYRERSISQQVFALGFKVLIFGVVASQYIGFSKELFIGTSLFALPLLMGIFEDKFPKSVALQKWMPTGIIEMLVMTLGGFFIALSVHDRYPNAQTYVLLSFVLLSIPGFILRILSLFGVEGTEDWKVTKTGRYIYRVLGVVALGILIYIVLSGLLISNRV